MSANDNLKSDFKNWTASKDDLRLSPERRLKTAGRK
jgi:hypothetical protein